MIEKYFALQYYAEIAYLILIIIILILPIIVTVIEKIRCKIKKWRNKK